ncbi:MAG TPA: hypothetical protein VI278_00445 [Nitrososphaeraceae archaeon]|jgi:bacterioferritin (cytochrome b1)
MGQKGKQIVEFDVNEMLKDLNSAYADKLLAHYQYFLYAQVYRALMQNNLKT